MKNKLLKTIFILLIIISTILLLNSKVFAIEPVEVLTDTQIQGGEELEKLGETILGIITAVGIILAVIILIVIGIKYMTGSVEEKAGYKKAMLPYAIGCIILVCAPAIANIVYEMSEDMQATEIIQVRYHKENNMNGHFYGLGCGKIEAYCNCNRNNAVFEEGYYCTGCRTLLYDGTYCEKCDVSY